MPSSKISALSATTLFEGDSEVGVANSGANEKWQIKEIGGINGRRALTGAGTLVASDRGKYVDCTSGTFTLAITAAATLKDGWHCWVRNTGTGVVTLDPNGAETIDGAATRILRQNHRVLLYCDGSTFYCLAGRLVKKTVDLPVGEWESNGEQPISKTAVGGTAAPHEKQVAWVFTTANGGQIVTNRRLPPDYVSGNLTFEIDWAPSNTNTNTLIWQILYKVIVVGAAVAPSDEATIGTTHTPGGVAEILAREAISGSITPTNPTDLFRLGLRRDAGAAGDTFTGDGWFFHLRMLYDGIEDGL